MTGEEVTKEVSVENDKNSVLKKEIESLRQELSSIKEMISGISTAFSNIKAANQQQNPTNTISQTLNTPLFSTGNRGVPTNRQTDNQATNQDVFAVVENLKSDLKIKFRNLTKQEFKVFSAIYILEQQAEVDYRTLARHLGLTEGSIRDYIMKLQNKGIPVVKTKINNKKVLISVRPELKEIASLDALMKVREPVFKLKTD